MVYTEYMLSSGKSPHSSPVSVFVHSLKENANGFKRDRKSWRIKKKYQTFKKKKSLNPSSRDKYLEWIQLYSSVYHSYISAYLTTEPQKQKNNNTSRNEKYKKKLRLNLWLCNTVHLKAWHHKHVET